MSRQLLMASIGGGLLLLIIVGVIIGWQLQPHSPPSTDSAHTSAAALRINSISFGAALGDATVAAEKQVFQSKDRYQVNQPFGIRITAANAPASPVDFLVRLINDKGSVIGLSPSTLRLQTASVSYCCWRVSKPGNYTFQLLRPQSGTTAFPLIVGQ
jgi:hypothetical protein